MNNTRSVACVDELGADRVTVVIRQVHALSRDAVCIGVPMPVRDSLRILSALS